MQRNNIYNTKQKDIILNVIKSKHSDFTIKDLYNELNGDVGLTTIYRLIDKLVIDGYVSKEIKNNKTYYQYLERCDSHNHFYLKCNNCGCMIHIDCDCILDLSNHILQDHKFKLSQDHIIINGICCKCGGNHEKSI